MPESPVKSRTTRLTSSTEGKQSYIAVNESANTDGSEKKVRTRSLSTRDVDQATPRPPSRLATIPASHMSPAKALQLSAAGKLGRSLSRPLWNSSKANTSVQSPSKTPSTLSKFPRSRVGSKQSPEESFANTTFISAVSGYEPNGGRENRIPSPVRSRFDSKDLKRQGSLLNGFGFGRSVNTGTTPTQTNVLKQSTASSIASYNPEVDPIKAYLRIRPPIPSSIFRAPYLHVVDDTEVTLAPDGPGSNALDSSRYKFTHVYPSTTSQTEFFEGTTLPLVKDMLNGQSSLCFAYGVTASGKTYTVQGSGDSSVDGKPGDPGLLPRAMDVVFNSITGKHSWSTIRPAGLTGFEISPTPSCMSRSQTASTLGQDSVAICDETVVEVDKNFEYSVWISYAEIYNEKIYDLLEGCSGTSKPSCSSMSPSSSTASLHSLTASLAEQVKHAAQQFSVKAAGSGGIIKRKALSLKHDRSTSNGSKYVAGLTELRVHSAAEAKALLRKGQINRTVFSTFANRASSRSHSVFTIKVLRIPIGLSDEDAFASRLTTTARMSVVDLAGTERSRNAHTSGERLKEAGNINKSLMVLGQCMEVIRRNQQCFTCTGRKPSLVPFRHSKLTELFQSFFEHNASHETGSGKVVMIVNVNPYDTGYDENSHVMKFAAVASEVVTSRDRGGGVQSRNQSLVLQNLKRGNELTAASLAKMAIQDLVAEEDSFIVDENVEDDEDEDELEQADVFVDHLLDEVSALRQKLLEAEIRANLIEAQVREQVMQEMNLRMLEMEEAFTNRLNEEAEEAELKTDRKIDILSRATMSSQQSNQVDEVESEYEDDEDIIEKSLPPSPTPIGRRPVTVRNHSSDQSDQFESARSSRTTSCESNVSIGSTCAGIEAIIIEDDDDSMVIKPKSRRSTSSKPKRPLRNTKVCDLEDLDFLNDSAPPSLNLRQSVSSTSRRKK